MNNIIFFGPPGAGKGTQAKIISEFLNIPHLSTGDILRKKLLDNDNLANQLKTIMSSGNLVSDDILNEIVSSRLNNEEKNGFILDGYPRTLKQSEFLNSFLSETSKKINFIFNIKINFETLKNRILKRSSQESREDDNVNVIETRYNEYIKSTQEVSNFYKFNHPATFYELDGSLQITEITDKIIKILKKS
ncbi:adenylate kinase [Pelagibacteraceae bacterium]|nr:adenylate kinase [Pelagibacteraceae bacterium]